MLALIAFIFTVGVLVTVHELGHFLAAKIIGVEVKTFAFGFPPRIWSKKIGKTEYAINALPLGGYVSLKGEEGEEVSDPSDKTNLLNRTPLEQFFVFVAGVLMNFLLAIFLFWLIFSIGFQPIFSGDFKYQGLTDTRKTLVDQVEKGSPAEKEDIRVGDQIIKVDGHNIKQYQEVINDIQSKSGQDGAKVQLEIIRDGQTLDKTLSTYKSKVKQGTKEVEVNRIGVVLKTDGQIKANPLSAIYIAVLETGRISVITIQGIFDLFATILTQFKLTSNVAGPIGIVVAGGVLAQMGFIYLLQFIAALSITLAIFNILPIPALDGGRIFFTFIETISRRKFSVKVFNIVQLVGFSLIIVLMVAIAIKDIQNFDIIGSVMNVFKR